MTVIDTLPADAIVGTEADETRVAVLRALGILDSGRDEAFDRVTRMASRLLGSPIAAVSLVDRDRQWFKSIVGLDVCETGRDVAFCSHTIQTNEPLVVCDATQDPRFAGNPLVTDAPGIRFYAGVPLVLPEGDALGSLCVIDLQTRERPTEHQLALLRDLAAVVVDEILLRRALAQTEQARWQLERARSEAEQATRAKSDFLAMMSHEIRTPMSGVLGMLDCLARGPLDSSQSEQLAIARGSAEALLVILNDILDLSKIEAGRLELESVTFSAAGLAREVKGLFGPQAEAKRLAFEVEVDPSVPAWLVGDQGRIRQMLYNLVSNALKFTETGGVTVRIVVPGSAASGEAAGESCDVVFEVLDTGPGVPEDRQHELFRRFSQIDRSYARRFGGTGLGLAITRSLAELMGGSVGVESRRGGGSRFHFRLPLVAAGPAQGGASSREPAPAAALDVLVVEDNRINQLVIRGLLEQMQFRVEVVADGAAAVEEALAGSYDLVLMDLSMPVMDGIEATRAIRAREAPGRRVPIFALTANVMDDDRRNCLEAGMDDFVTKPIVKETFLAALARLAPRDL